MPAHPLLDRDALDGRAGAFLASVGEVFATFAAPLQDSGNVSYGVRIGAERYFVKTAGDPADPLPRLGHAERVALLRNAASLARSCSHPAVPPLLRILESPHGPLLVYRWADGELLYAPSAERDWQGSAARRFRALPVAEIEACLDTVYALHRELARAGWVAVDFYDGCLLYDFAARRVTVMDLDMYHRGPFVNETGRMFGSSRFMAPEQHTRGATVDERTTVYTMGRAAAVLLGDGTLARSTFRGSTGRHEVIRRACRPAPDERFPTVDAFYDAWCSAG